MLLILRRVGLYVLTAWVAITVNFALPRLMPGNPIQNLIGKIQTQVTPEEINAIGCRLVDRSSTDFSISIGPTSPSCSTATSASRSRSASR